MNGNEKFAISNFFYTMRELLKNSWEMALLLPESDIKTVSKMSTKTILWK